MLHMLCSRHKCALKDLNGNKDAAQNSSQPPPKTRRNICRCFNQDTCVGPQCKYEHLCNLCFKAGHSALDCLKGRPPLRLCPRTSPNSNELPLHWTNRWPWYYHSSMVTMASSVKLRREHGELLSHFEEEKKYIIATKELSKIQLVWHRKTIIQNVWDLKKKPKSER